MLRAAGSTARGRRLATLGVTAAAGAVALLLVSPVVRAPIGADDRYWVMDAYADSADSYLGVVRFTWEEIPQAASSGRLAPLASLARRLVGLTVARLGIATDVTMAGWMSVLKVVLLAAVVAAWVALLAALRARTPRGELVGLRRRTLWLVTVLGTVLLALGARVGGFRNGWTAYPLLTYGSLVVALLVVALAVVLARSVARRPRAGPRLLAAAGMALVALVLALSYEIVYVAAPLALVALVLQPVAARTAGVSRREAWVARAWVGAPLAGTFLAAALAARVYASSSCPDGRCYEGVSTQLGLRAVETWVLNVLTPAPFPAVEVARQALRDPGSYPWSSGALLAGVGTVAVLAAAWRLALPRPSRRDPERSAAEARILGTAALLSGLLAVGTAAIVSVSAQPQEEIRGLDVPYRNMVMTWGGLAFALVTGVVALAVAGRLGGRGRGRGRGRGGRGVTAGLLVVALAAGAVAALLQVRNEHALSRIVDGRVQRAVSGIQREVVRGDLTPEGEARRCALVARMQRASPSTAVRVVRAAQDMHRQAFGVPFCSRPPPPVARG